MRAQQYSDTQPGSVRYDKRRKTWNYLWYDGATRRSKLIGNKEEFPTKAAAWREVERLQIRTTPKPEATGSVVRDVITRNEVEQMPSRNSTAGCIAREHARFLRRY